MKRLRANELLSQKLRSYLWGFRESVVCVEACAICATRCRRGCLSWRVLVVGKSRACHSWVQVSPFLSCSTTQIEGEGSSTIAMQVARQNLISGASKAKNTRW